jgi:hypothetical protein|tara:strand:+ start:213 stop:476 length:264 start_codon:yes stop_codon:yes gene_type:complete
MTFAFLSGLAELWEAVDWQDVPVFFICLFGLYWGKNWIDLRFSRKKAQIVHKVKIVGDSHINIDHAHIDEIDHNHIEGDVNTHPKTW